jgi:hypothetical protein
MITTSTFLGVVLNVVWLVFLKGDPLRDSGSAIVSPVFSEVRGTLGVKDGFLLDNGSSGNDFVVLGNVKDFTGLVIVSSLSSFFVPVIWAWGAMPVTFKSHEEVLGVW